MTICELVSMYPEIPAEDETSAIMLSSVSSRIVIHLTNAKDVKEKTNVMQAAAAIDGINKGAHRFLILESRLLPFGRSLNCSSKRGSNVESNGSQNRM